VAVGGWTVWVRVKVRKVAKLRAPLLEHLGLDRV